MTIPPELFDVFSPSADLLLDWTRRHSDDVILTDIANADYRYRADELLPVLRQIRASGIIPDPLEWQLHEELALTR